MERQEIARITMQHRRNQERPEKIARLHRCHRRTKTFSVPASSLAISVQGISRLADARPGGRTEKPRRGDALARKKFEFLLYAQRAGAGGNLGKENRALFEDFDGGIDTMLMLR